MSSITTIRTGFLESDDRLLIDFVFPQETATFLATRRITRRLIRGLAQILANPNSALARVPSTHKTEMLIWEHLSSINPTGGALGGGKGAAPGEPPQRNPAPWPLLHTVNITALDTVFRLSFESADRKGVTMEMSRQELHRLLANMRQLARHAEWDLDAEVSWLVEADSPEAMRPGSLAS